MKYLIEKGYKEYSDSLYENRKLFQKEVESEAVCELNENLAVNVFEWDHSMYNPKSVLMYEVEITAERKGQWWKLCSYSYTAEELEEKLEFIEQTLIKLFNTI